MRRSFECVVRDGCPGTDRGRRSLRTTRRTLRIGHTCVNPRLTTGAGCANLTPSPSRSVYAGPHDYACAHVQPPLVGRLTAADLQREHACAHGRRYGGRFCFSLPGSGSVARRGGLGTTHVQGRAGHDEDLQRGQADRTSDAGELPGGRAAVGRRRPGARRGAVLRRRSARADRRARSRPAYGDSAGRPRRCCSPPGWIRSGARCSCRAMSTSTRGWRTCWSAPPPTESCGG